MSNWGFWRNEGDDSRWFWALKEVSLSVSSPGTCIGLIGANGSGKTTLLRIIAGVTKPTRGLAVTNGRIVPLLELYAGMQVDLTGRENIYINGIILGMRRREINQKFDSIVDFSGIADFIDMPLKHYSLGMIMRLGFSVASHIEAPIILADEIWSIGDVDFQRKSMDRLQKLRKNGAILIVVSHDLEIVQKVSDEVAWLEQGRLMAHGPAEQVIPQYLKTMEGSADGKAPSSPKPTDWS